MPSRSAAVYSGRDVDALGRLPRRRRRRRPASSVAGAAPVAAGWSRSRGCSWHLQEVEELGQRGPHVDADVDRPARCRPAACRRCSTAVAPAASSAAATSAGVLGVDGVARAEAGDGGARTCGSASAISAGSSVTGPGDGGRRRRPRRSSWRTSARGVNVAGVPIVARKTAGPRARRGRGRVDAPAQRLEPGRPSGPGAGPLSPAGRRLGDVRELGEPGERRPPGVDVALPGRRGSPPAARRPARSTPRRRRPPAASISWNHAHAASASSSVKRSTYHEPPAGSMTSARCDSRIRIDCVLRPMRRPSSVASPPRRWSWGSTVTASAPATPAAKQATVERSMFTHGS